ncbi:hypothetical protein LIER_10434 [Lithospermum erythrorhizon]|uniref:Uncharacterized protein n=1 Tax=Lithospermum erythrorhizon TaxID=34254 RepID=A0AAV3PM31_LITER
MTTWRLFSPDVPPYSPKKNGKGKSLSPGIRPSSLIFKSSGSSKRKPSLENSANDRDPKHTRGTRKEASSSCGSRGITVAYPTPERFLIPIPLVIPNNAVEEQVVEVSSSAVASEHIKLVDTGESPECFATEIAKSSPLTPPVISLAREADNILRAGAPSLWTRICTRLEATSPDMVLKEEVEVISTFRVLARLGLEVIPDLYGKLHDLFRMAREAVSSLVVARQNEVYEISCELTLLMMSSEDLALKRHCEVQEVEELDQEAATLEARARDLRVQAQERKSIITQLDLEAADTSQQIHTLEEKVRAQQAKHLGSLSAELEVARVGLVVLL